MMKKTISIFITAAALFACSSEPQQCVIIGEVFDRPNSKMIYIMSADANPRNPMTRMEVPLVDGKFTATIDASQPEVMSLYFDDEIRDNRCWDIKFMNEADTVRFKLYPLDNREKNVVKGSELNQRYLFLSQEPERLFPTKILFDSLYAMSSTDKYLTPQAREWRKKMEQIKTPQERDSLYKLLDTLDVYISAYDSLETEIDRRRFYQQTVWLANEALGQQTPAELAWIVERLREAIVHKQKIVNLEQLIEVYQTKFREKFEANHLTMLADEMIGAYKNIKVGGQYIDFTAPDLQGQQVRLSDKIAGKVAVIDMWSSWCAPCIRGAINLIPIYEKYKDKGFEVVGIARETESMDAAKKVLDDHKFPWTTLAELDDKGRLWYKYGIQNAAGCSYLIDRDGTILLVNPSAEQVETKIKEILK